MRLREDDPTPDGYESWQPRMGRGGKVVAWLILLMIVLGSAAMVWETLQAMG